MAETRKLAAILAADVVGYSRLAGTDEDRTLARLRALRSDLIDPTVAVHNGRVVKRTGDGSLIEFRSVVDAVRCAIEVQNGMVERNAGVPPERRIEFRVGIHLGDVVEESDGDLMGDGVNIAARLESIAEPGGICLSEDAYRQVRDRLKEQFVDIGDRKLKNIARPVRAYRLALDQNASKSEPAASEKPPASLALPDKPSIAVLAFQNMSGDPEQEYFADGITEDVITDLSKIGGLLVIARNSSFAYKGKQVDIRIVARELGVRTVLEGSIRRAGGRVRINAQLIDAQTGGHLWTERFDRELSDIFAVQDEVTRRIVDALKITLSPGEAATLAAVETTNSKAHDFFLAGREFVYGPTRNREMFERTIDLFQKAIAEDPDYGEPYAGVAWAHVMNWQNGTVTRTVARLGSACKMAYDDLFCPPPVPACDYPARRLALSAVHAQLSRCRRSPRGARPGCLLRDCSAMGLEVRADVRPRTSPQTPAADLAVASRRNGRHDCGAAVLAVARC